MTLAETSLMGRRVLLVEDDYFIASDLAAWLESFGIELIGPAASVQEALELLDAVPLGIDGAILDVNLSTERVFPVADALMTRTLPFMFLTGYDSATVPEIYQEIPRMEKPVHKVELIRMVAAMQADVRQVSC